jgi:hypothetical protein
MAEPPPKKYTLPLSQWLPRVRLQVQWPQSYGPVSQGLETGPLPYLPDGRSYYAVIDVEALVMGRVDVVLQAAIVVVDAFGREMLGEKHMVYQPLNAEQLAASYNLDRAIVDRGVYGYELVTHDNYVHADPNRFERWGAVRKRIQQICQRYALVVYAKGIELEYRVFYGELPFYDLAWYGCPKYPLPVHDPLMECRYFSSWIPDLISRPVYLF